MTDIASVAPRAEGLWRVGRSGANRLEFVAPDCVDVESERDGNRFDSFSGRYGTLYFGTTLDVCFAETLARFRPNPRLVARLGDEWESRGWMQPGSVPADWRNGRMISRVELADALPFVDVDHPDTIAYFNRQPELMAGLGRFGIDELDLGALTGRDRRVTRYIAESFFDAANDDGDPLWSGLRYMSRLGEGWECWAVFEGTNLTETYTPPILPSNPALRSVAERFQLTVH
jgi:hypothetical protein